MKPDFVFNSENYRVTTREGSTTLSRTNIKGNKQVKFVPDVPSSTKISINEEWQSQLTPSQTYSFDVTIDGTLLPTFSFVYTTNLQLLTDLANHINGSFGSTVATVYDATTPYVLVSTSGTTTVLISNFSYVSGGWSYIDYTTSLNQPVFGNGGSLHDWVATDSGTAGITKSNDPLLIPIGGQQTWVTTIEGVNGPASWYELKQTLPFALPTGNYYFELMYACPYILQDATALIRLHVGTQAISAYNIYLGDDYSGINGAPVRSTTTSVTPLNNEMVIRVEVTPTSPTAPPPTGFQIFLVGVRIFGPGLYNNVINIENNYIVGQTNLEIIGWTNIRDDIYLFTTDCNTPDPGNTDPSSYGQIWKFTYDKTADPTLTTHYQLTLIYNGLLNFSRQHPILNPGRVVARYENPSIQKIYWSDNFNPPRYINVADPNVNSLTPNELLLNPSIEFDIPNITGISKGGNLRAGMYQYVYRLKRNNGAETRFSMPSALTFLTVFDENTTDFVDYYAVESGTTVDKSIELSISNVDTSFDRIEVAFIYYGPKNDTPETFVFYEGLINNNPTITLKHTGEEDQSYPVTIDELTTFSNNIVRAKALAIKNNTLFLANVKTNTFDPDYDARAFRFPLNSATTTIYDYLGTPYTVNSSTWKITHVNGISITTPYDIPDTFDCIQDYDDQAPFSTRNLLYKPSSASATVLTNIGGSGANISYEFVEYDVLADENDIGATTPAAGSYTKAPYRNILSKPNTTIQLGDRDHTSGNFYECFVSPYYAPLMAGYQRDEMYRFGIVFFDRLGNPSYTKWISDIRIPHVYMPDGINKEDRFLAYPLVEYDSTLKKAYTKQIYLKFNVTNVPAAAKGFQIVVVPRTDNDKNIIAQGVFNFAQKDYASGISSTAFFLSHDSATGLGGSNYYPVNLRQGTQLWHNVGSIKSPEFDFRGFQGYQTGDYVDFVSILDNVQQRFVYGVNCNNALDGNNSPSEDVAWTVNKAYSHVDNSNKPYTIKDSSADGPLYNIHEAFKAASNYGSVSYSPGVLLNYDANSRVGNFSPVNTNTAFVTRSSYGGNCVALIFGGNLPTSGNIGGSADFLDNSFSGRDFADLDGWTSSSQRYIVNYKRSLSAQYNGNSYTQRSFNFYVPASNFFKVQSGITNYNDLLIAGGDTYTQVYDTVLDFPDWGRRVGDSKKSVMDPSGASASDNSITDAVGAAGITMCVPLESTINSEIRGEDIKPACIPNSVNPYGEDVANSLDREESFEATDSDLYSWNPYYMVHPTKPVNFQDINEFDVRTYKSEQKTNSEDVDSWTIFRPDAYKDVESTYGPINNLILFKDKLFYFQDRGFGIFQVNAQQLVQDATSTSELVLGTSGILDRFDYISTVVGSKMQSGFALSDNTLLFTDLLGRKIYTFTGEGLQPLSDVKGLNAYMYRKLSGDIQNNDNPYIDLGLTATYDNRYNEFLLSMYEKNEETNTTDYFTVAYSEVTGGFTSFYSFYPRVYINDKLNIFTVPCNLSGEGGTIYVQDYGMYGRFYGFGRPAVDSKLSFLVNHEPDKEKILTNFEFVTESYDTTGNYGEYDPYAIPVPYDFFKTIRVFNTYQNTDFIPTTNIAKRRKTLWNVIVPGNRVLYNNATNVDIFDVSNISPTRLSLSQRMKDRWFMVDTTYNNANDYRFTVSAATSLIMLNTR